MGFAILWGDALILQHDVKICDLLYMGRQAEKHRTRMTLVTFE
jgi:hypothetical protein